MFDILLTKSGIIFAVRSVFFFFFFFFNDTATTEIYTLSLHDALPILLYMFRDTVIAFLRIINYQSSSSCCLKRFSHQHEPQAQKKYEISAKRESEYCQIHKKFSPAETHTFLLTKGKSEEFKCL